MKIWIGITIGIKEILAHKFRSLLTMLGIILGVCSLLSMFALTEGIARGMKETLNLIGGLEQVEVVEKEISPELLGLKDVSPGLTLHDAEAIRLGAPLISHVSPIKVLGTPVSHGANRISERIQGVLPDYLAVDNHTIGMGRTITQLDVDHSRRVAVIGSLIVDDLWPGQAGTDPVGQTIYIRQVPYTVVGVFSNYEREEDKRRREAGVMDKQKARQAERGGRSRGWQPFTHKNRTIVIPITTLINDFNSATVDANGVDWGPNLKLNDLELRVANLDYYEQALHQVTNVLNFTHRGIDDFGFQTREDWFDQMQSSIRATRISGGLIAGISLLVGGIGITNIMLASITERIREIGVRLAVGARRRDIFFQILVESGVLGLLGGLLGLAGAALMIRVLVLIAPTENIPVVTPGSILISFGFAVAVGIVSGLYPAWKASNLDPITALRYE